MGGRNQPSFDAVSVQVVQLFPPLLFAPDVQVVEAPLPDAMRPVKVDGGRQAEFLEHASAPGKGCILAQHLEHKFGRALPEALDDLGRIGVLGGPNQQMEMLGHQDVTEDFEAQGSAKPAQRLDEVLAETRGVKKARAAISAGRKLVKMIKAVIMTLTRHEEILHPGVAHMRQTRMYAPLARINH